MSHHWSVTALRIVILSTIGFGLMSFASAIAPLAYPADLFTDLMVWPPDGAETTAAPPTRLAWALIGGFLTSWGVLQWLILTRIGALDAALARQMLLVSVGVWFVLDSTASILGGVPVNAAANCLFLALYAVPILALPDRTRTMSTGARP